jgi:predicted nucleic-acid-binding protein
MNKIIVDTDILIRLIVNDDKTLAKKAQNLINGKKVIISSIVLAETIFVLTSYYKYSKKQLFQLKEFLEVENFYLEDKEINYNAIDMYCKNNLHFVDCWLYCKSKIEGRTLLSLDNKLNRLDTET